MSNMLRFFIISIALMFNCVSHAFQKEETCYLVVSGKCVLSIGAYFDDKEYEVYPTSGSTDADKALNSYYRAATKNDIPTIINSFSSADGSRELISDQLSDSPSKFARFNAVSSVDVLKSARLGNYTSYRIRWYGSSGARLTDWMEMVVCTSECKMSNRVMSQTDETALYALATTPGLAIQPKSGQLSFSFPYPKSSAFPVTVNANISPIDIKNPGKANVVINFLDGFIKKEVPVLSDGGWETYTNDIFDYLESYWVGADRSTAYYVAEKSGETMSDPIRNSLQYMLLMNQLESYRVLHSLESDTLSLILVELNLKDKVAYQYFYVGSEGKIVPRANVDSSQSVAVEVLHNPLVLRQLVEGL